jgi:hypothetical protein
MLIVGAALPFLGAISLGIPEADGRFIRNLDPGGDGSGNLIVELLVAPDQAVEGCKVLSRISDAGAKRVCDQARRMKVRVVASDLDGTPIYGFVNVARIVAQNSGSRGRSAPIYPVDVQIGVLDIPGHDNQKTIFVAVLVDESGAIAHCEADREDNEREREFVQVACREASGHSFPVVHDRTGAAVRHVRVLRVDFVNQALTPS